MNCAEVPLRTHARPRLSARKLALGVELRDVTRGFGAFSNAFCGKQNHKVLLIPEDGACGCLLRFHGRYFPITGRREQQGATICFEFPVLELSSEARRDYEYVNTHAFSLLVTLKLEFLGV